MSRSNISCCVYRCPSTRKNTAYLKPHVIFYSFPHYNWEVQRKQIWITFAARLNPDGSEWQPTKYSRICSRHFVGGEKSQHPQNPSYNPTIRPDKFPDIPVPGTITGPKRTLKRVKNDQSRMNKMDEASNNLEIINEDSIKPPQTLTLATVKRTSMACQTRAMRMKARMSKYKPKPKPEPEPDPMSPLPNEVMADEEKVQLKNSLEAVLNWIRTKHDGGNGLPLDVLELVDPALRDEFRCYGKTDNLTDNYDDNYSPSPNSPVSDSTPQLDTKNTVPKSEIDKLKCSQCGKQFPSAVELSKHSLTHCTIALLRLPHESRLKAAKKIKIKLHEAPRPVKPKLKPGEKLKKFKCGVCGMFLKHRHTLIAHFKALHAPKKQAFPCTTCHKTFTRASHVRKHVNHLHAQDEECLHCGELHSSKTKQLHVDKVHLGKRYQCKLCEFQMEDVGLIRSHMYQKHPTIAQTTSNSDAVNIIFLGPITADEAAEAEEKKKVEKTPHICRICNHEFPTMYKRRMHMEMVHRKNPETETPRERSTLKKCRFCSEVLKTKYQYRLHIDLKHKEGLKSFQCSICSRVFNRELNLRRHVRNMHPVNPVTHLCSTCGMTFKRKDILEGHVSRVHEKQAYNFKCENCPAVFAHKADLKKHEDRHFNRGRLQCPICGLMRPANQLKSHVEYVHKGKRFQCKFCDAVIHQQGQIRPHLLLKHLEFVDSIKAIDTVNVIYVKPTHGILQKQKVDREGQSLTVTAEDVQTVRPRKKSQAAYSCLICDAIFHSKDTHEVHKIKHERDPEYRLKQRKRVERLVQVDVEVSTSEFSDLVAIPPNSNDQFQVPVLNQSAEQNHDQVEKAIVEIVLD